MTTTEALQGMRALVAEGWMRGHAYAVGRRIATRHQFLEAREKGKKCRVCASGALELVVGCAAYYHWHLAVSALLWRAFPDLTDRPGGVDLIREISPSIFAMNDTLNTQEEALAWIDRAIALAQREEQE